MKKKCLCTTWGVNGENLETNGCPLHIYHPPLKPLTELEQLKTQLKQCEETLLACWYFIENVGDDDPERTNKFFELRVKVREYLWEIKK
jgi:hypothetical protein